MSKPRRVRQPNSMYCRCDMLVRPETGEQVKAWVPLAACDREEMEKYGVGSITRHDIKKARSPQYWRWLHALAKLVSQNAEGFPDDAHATVKRLQRESGLFCEDLEIDLGPLGKVTVRQPRGLSFDRMEEGDFNKLAKGLCDHIAANYWPGMTAAAVDRQAKMIEH